MQVLSIFQCVAKVWNSWVKMEQMLSTCPWPKSLAKNSAPDRRICFFFFFPFYSHCIFRSKWENVCELSLDSIKVTDATFSGLLRDLQTMDWPTPQSIAPSMGEQWTDLRICIVTPVPRAGLWKTEEGPIYLKRSRASVLWSFLRPRADDVWTSYW